MAEAYFSMPGGWQESFIAQQPFPEKPSSRFTNYRVSNIEARFDKLVLKRSLTSALSLPAEDEIQVWSLAPSLTYPEKKIATFSLKGSTGILKAGETERHVFLDDDTSHSEREPVVIDTHFLGFTPLNNIDDARDHKLE